MSLAKFTNGFVSALRMSPRFDSLHCYSLASDKMAIVCFNLRNFGLYGISSSDRCLQRAVVRSIQNGGAQTNDESEAKLKRVARVLSFALSSSVKPPTVFVYCYTDIASLGLHSLVSPIK